uniref:Pericentriolar material 1 protein C-terminal domain-containing protein n=1 Tax=Plectus sambesii TaxID=2011161 RepID=A0A914VVI9_9BILA
MCRVLERFCQANEATVFPLSAPQLRACVGVRNSSPSPRDGQQHRSTSFVVVVVVVVRRCRRSSPQQALLALIAGATATKVESASSRRRTGERLLMDADVPPEPPAGESKEAMTVAESDADAAAKAATAATAKPAKAAPTVDCDPLTMLGDGDNLPAKQQHVLDRLTDIRAYKRRILDALDQMKRKADGEEIDKTVLAELIQSYDDFKQQEEQYLELLKQIISIRQNAADDVASEVLQVTETVAPPPTSDDLLPTPPALTSLDDQLDNSDFTSDETDDARSLESDQERQIAALSQQRELLTQMVRQQEQLRALQGRQTASKLRQDSEADSAAQEVARARELVAKEMRAVVAKKEELAELRRRVAVLGGGLPPEAIQAESIDTTDGESQLASGDSDNPQPIENVESASSNDERTDAESGEEATRRLIESKLQSLNSKKRRMDEIMGRLAAFSKSPARAEHTAPEHPTAAAEPVEEEEQEEQVAENSEQEYEQRVAAAHSRLAEISSVKERLFEIQRLTQQAVEMSDRGEPIPPGLHEQLNALTEEQLAGMPLADEDEEGEDGAIDSLADGVAGLSSSVRSAYEDKVREQQRVLYSLQEEKSRLASIKNELSRLRRGSAGADADRTSDDETGGEQSDVAWNNRRYADRSPSGDRGGSRSARAAPPAIREPSSSPGPAVVQTSRLVDEPTARNPRLASFRRNNELHSGECRSAISGDTLEPPQSGRLSRRSSVVSDVQVSQLDHHFEQIKLILSDINAVQSGSPSGCASVVGPPPLIDANSWMQQQQQHMMITASLLACQQQLQMQQNEMRQLQQIILQLTSGQQLPAGAVATSPRPLTPQQIHSPTQLPGGMLPPHLTQPHHFDGRPLSSASLYNLLSPNPLYYAPYGLNQIQPAMLNQSWPAHAPPPAPFQSTTAGPRRMSAMTDDSMAGQPTLDYAHFYGRPAPSNVDQETTVPPLDLNTSHDSQTAAARYVDDVQQAPIADKQTNLAAARVRSSRNSEASVASSRRSTNHSSKNEDFDQLRENIYSEVAMLISQNEQQPQFLIELFRELQLLSSDYLRDRALDAVRDLLTRFLMAPTTDTETDENHSETNGQRNRVTQHTKHRSGKAVERATSEDEVDHHTTSRRSHHHADALSERESEGNSEWSSTNNDHRGAAANRRQGSKKRFENFEGINTVKDEILNNARGGRERAKLRKQRTLERIRNRTESISSEHSSPGEAQEADTESLEATPLEKQVEQIIDDLLPFVKENSQATCTPQLLQYMRKLVLTVAESKCFPSGGVTDFFQHQLSSILEDTLAKYSKQPLGSCSEELLTDVSEVVFNELAFFRLMQNIESVDTKQVKNKARRESLISDAENDLKVIETQLKRNGPRKDTNKAVAAASSSLAVPGADDNRSEVSDEVLSVRTAISVSKEAAKVSQERPDEEDENRKLSTPRLPVVTTTSASDRDSLHEIDEEIQAVIDPQTDPEPVEVTFDLSFDPKTEVAATLSLGGASKVDNVGQNDQNDSASVTDPADPNQVTVLVNGSTSPDSHH